MEEVLSSAFLEYAGYNLQRRAIPDVRDGLKWGTRQLLHSQMVGKFTYDKPFKKAIKSVSQAMGFSYVHGDASAYGTFIRMAKPFVMNVPLQEAKGNYGTLIDPDTHSASRYVEMRGSEAAAYLLKDLNKNVIDEWEDTYDLEDKFPKVLPAKGFWGLTNGCISIGSGMSCSVPPMNLKELNTALIKLLWNPEASDEEIIVLPDFPTGATILNASEVRESLKKGYGFACKIRATIDYDNAERCFIVKEMPYSTYTNTICKELAALLDSDEDCGIKEFCDYTKQQPDLRIYLTKTANPAKVLKRLYKETSLQTFYAINMVLLENGQKPKTYGLREAMVEHLKHEETVYRRGFEFDLKKIKDRLHIINGLLKAINNIDEVIITIKTSTSTAAANLALQKLLDIDEVQAKAILDIKLSRLAKLEIKKLINEKEELEAEAKRIQAILNSEELLKKEIEKGLREVADKFGDARRTQILNIEKEDEEPVEVKSLIVNLTNQNNVFIEETSSLYTTRRGSVGSKFKLDKNEYVTSCCNIQTTDNLLFFSDDGLYYSMLAADLPYEKKSAIESFLPVKNSAKVTSMVALNNNTENEFVIFFTKNGLLKKTKLSEYNTKRSTGIKALELDGGDSIVSIIFTNTDRVGMLSAKGQFLICETKDIRAIGRISKGVKGIKLNEGDYVTAAKVIPNEYTSIISITQNGLVKQIAKEEFTINGRYTKGSKIHKIDEDIVVDFLPINLEKEIIVCSTKTQVKIAVSEIPLLSKQAAGVKSVKLKDDQNIVNLAAV